MSGAPSSHERGRVSLLSRLVTAEENDGRYAYGSLRRGWEACGIVRRISGCGAEGADLEIMTDNNRSNPSCTSTHTSPRPRSWCRSRISSALQAGSSVRASGRRWPSEFCGAEHSTSWVQVDGLAGWTYIRIALTASGGKFTIRLLHPITPVLYESLLFALIGDQFDESDNVVGCVLSVRQTEDILSVWVEEEGEAVRSGALR